MQNQPTQPRLLKTEAQLQAALEMQEFCAQSLRILAGQHLVIHAHIGSVAKVYWEAGKILAELKDRLAGRYDEFIKENKVTLGFGRTTAYIYRQFYIQHAERSLDNNPREFILVDRTKRKPIQGDVKLKGGHSGWAGVVNRFELEWERWEQAGADGQEEAREVTRPMYERLRRLHEEGLAD